MKTLAQTILALLFVFLVGWITISENKRKSLKSKIKAIEQLNDSLEVRMENYTTYMLIDIEQNNIIDMFQSSRSEKLSNDMLMELQQKLN